MKNKQLTSIGVISALLTQILILAQVSVAETNSNPNPSLTLGTSINSSAVNDSAANGITVFAWLKNLDGIGGCSDSESGVYYQRFDNAGVAIDPSPVAVETTCQSRSSLDISVDRVGNFSIGWVEGATPSQNVKFNSYKYDGTQIGSTFTPNPSTLSDNPKISIALQKHLKPDGTAAIDENLAVVWDGADSDYKGIYARIYEIDYDTGTVGSVASPVQVNNANNSANDQNSPKVSWSKTHAGIVWSGTGINSNGIDLSSSVPNAVWFQAIKTDGTLLDNNFIVSEEANDTYHGNIAANLTANTDDNVSDTFFIAWDGEGLVDTSGIFLKKLFCSSTSCNPNSNSNPDNSTHQSIRVNSTTSGTQNYPQIAVYQNLNPTLRSGTLEDNSISYLNVSYLSDTTILSQNFKNNLARNNTEFTVGTNSSSNSPFKSSMDEDGDLTISFKDDSGSIVANRYANETYKYSTESLVSSANPGDKNNSATAVGPNGNYVIAYETDEFDSGDIVFKLYDKRGNVLKNLTIANDKSDAVADDDGQQANPSVAFFTDSAISVNQGNFIIAWEGAGPSDNHGIFYRIFDASGNAIAPTAASELRANTDTVCEPCTQSNPKVSAGKYTSDGNDSIEYVITWEGETDDDSDGGIGVHFHNQNVNSGNPIVAIANASATTGVQSNPDVIIDSTGSRFVVIWMDGANDIMKTEATIISNSIDFSTPTSIATSSPTLDIDNDAPRISGSKLGISFDYTIVYAAIDLTGDPIHKIIAENYTFDDGQNGSDIVVTSNSSPLDGDEITLSEPNIVSDKNAGNTLFTWVKTATASNALNENQAIEEEIYGQFYKYNTTNNLLEVFGPAFRINSRQAGSQYNISTGMNSESNEDEEKIFVTSWNHFYGSDNNTVNGIRHQLFSYPIFLGTAPVLQPETTQIIESGGKTISVPSSLAFGNVNVNDYSSALNFRDQIGTNYIEITDLDGSPFTLTATATDLFLSTNPLVIIPNSNLKIQNCDTTSPSIVAVQGQTTDIDLDPSSSCSNGNTFADYSALDSAVTILNKTGYTTGKWQIFPRIMIFTGASSSTGSYTGTITFTLA